MDRSPAHPPQEDPKRQREGVDHQHPTQILLGRKPQLLLREDAGGGLSHDGRPQNQDQNQNPRPPRHDHHQKHQNRQVQESPCDQAQPSLLRDVPRKNRKIIEGIPRGQSE